MIFCFFSRVKAKRSAWNIKKEPVDAPINPPPVGRGNGRGSIEASGSGASSNPIRTPRSSSSDARGGMRGRRPNPFQDLVQTRPPELDSKTGVTGNSVRLTANFFRMVKSPTWSLYQYHVDFAPEVEVNAVRKGLLRVHTATLGGNVFDGTTLYLTNRLNQDVSEYFSKNRLGENIRMTLKFVGLVSMREGRSLQILNIIMRKALEGLNLQLVGRNFFDAAAKFNIHEFNLELWPGYLTSIRQHEQDILLCAEITHKVMRTDTVHDILRKVTQNSRTGSYQSEFGKAVIGMTVLTDYNNKFYRIDDVDFNTTPTSSFNTKTGTTTFVEYYHIKYNKRIKDTGQPMLISNSKARDIRAGQSETVALVPELCRATGITDEMRGNFQLMRAMGDFTRVQPDLRIKKLLEFNHRLYRSPESMAVFSQWQMKLDRNLVELTGRELANENIMYRGGVKERTDRNADWTTHFRGRFQLYNATVLKKWVVIHLNMHDNVVRDFIDVMIDAARGMGFQIARPQ